MWQYDVFTTFPFTSGPRKIYYTGKSRSFRVCYIKARFWAFWMDFWIPARDGWEELGIHWGIKRIEK